MPQEAPARQDESGFTLIELLIVIIVLGILAAIVVVAVGSTQSDALHAACATRVRSIVSSVEAARTESVAYPTGTVDVTTSPNPLVAPAPGALLKEWPTNDKYVLTYEGTGGTSYSIHVFRGDGTTAVSGCGAL